MDCITPKAFLLFFFPFILVCDSAGSAHSLHQCPCDLIHAAYLSHSVFFHTLTNAHTLWPRNRLEQWKEGLPGKPFRQNLRGWLESFNSNKAGRKACLLLVIPHLLDKASQGSSAALNWCTYPYLYRSSLWLGERENLTGLAVIQALMPICLSSFMAELAFSGAIFQAMRDMVFSLSLPLLMQLCRVNIAGSKYMCLGEGQPGPPYSNQWQGYTTICMSVAGVSSGFHVWRWKHQVINLCCHGGNAILIP